MYGCGQSRQLFVHKRGSSEMVVPVVDEVCIPPRAAAAVVDRRWQSHDSRKDSIAVYIQKRDSFIMQFGHASKFRRSAFIFEIERADLLDGLQRADVLDSLQRADVLDSLKRADVLDSPRRCFPFGRTCTWTERPPLHQPYIMLSSYVHIFVQVPLSAMITLRLFVPGLFVPGLFAKTTSTKHKHKSHYVTMYNYCDWYQGCRHLAKAVRVKEFPSTLKAFVIYALESEILKAV